MIAIKDQNQALRYTVVIEPTNEPDNPGWYYAHIPTLDLTTHGKGPEGALQAARELVTGWIAELRASGKDVPREAEGFVAHVEIPLDAVQGH